MEDYLEAIYNLDKEKRVVRVRDIAKRLGVKMPTVTNMLKTLSKKGMIDYEKYLTQIHLIDQLVKKQVNLQKLYYNGSKSPYVFSNKYLFGVIDEYQSLPEDPSYCI